MNEKFEAEVLGEFPKISKTYQEMKNDLSDQELEQIDVIISGLSIAELKQVRNLMRSWTYESLEEFLSEYEHSVKHIKDLKNPKRINNSEKSEVRL